MNSKIICTLITVTWAIMMFGLMRDEVIPAVQHARELAQSASYEQLDKLVPESRVDQMGMYIGAQRVGQSTTWIKKHENEITITSETEINFKDAPLLKGARDALGIDLQGVITFRATIIDGRLQEFRTVVYSSFSSKPMVSIHGEPFADVLRLTIRQAGKSRVETVPFDSRQFLNNALAPALSYRNLEVGKRWRVKNLDFFNHTVQSAWAEVIAQETITINGEKHDAFVVLLSRDMYKARIWVSAEGAILKQQFMAFTFVREDPPEQALKELEK